MLRDERNRRVPLAGWSRDPQRESEAVADEAPAVNAVPCSHFCCSAIPTTMNPIGSWPGGGSSGSGIPSLSDLVVERADAEQVRGMEMPRNVTEAAVPRDVVLVAVAVQDAIDVRQVEPFLAVPCSLGRMPRAKQCLRNESRLRLQRLVCCEAVRIHHRLEHSRRKR